MGRGATRAHQSNRQTAGPAVIAGGRWAELRWAHSESVPAVVAGEPEAHFRTDWRDVAGPAAWVVFGPEEFAQEVFGPEESARVAFVAPGPRAPPPLNKRKPHGPPNYFPGKSSFGIDQKQLTLQDDKTLFYRMLRAPTTSGGRYRCESWAR